MFQKTFNIFLIFVILGFVLYVNKDKINKSASIPETQTFQETQSLNDFEIVTENLNIPWELAFLPDGDMLVTERGGKLLRVGKTTNVIAQISGVKHIGEGGLLGLVLDPDFKNNNYIYLYLTYSKDNKVFNKVERYQFDGSELKNKFIVIDGILGSKNHDGGRLAIGPDKYLYITTGDAEKPNLAQNKNSLNGKILRLDKDGSIPSDNPFGNAVYSYGHRNPQGLAWDKDGNLWETEHGPSGVQSGNDEINLIVKGGNYGWPIIKGEKRKDGMITPTKESGLLDTWAPSGMGIIGNNIFFAGLKGEALYNAQIVNNDNLNLKEYFKKVFGRIRTVVVGPDKNIYILTNNRDGRGKPKAGDDKIIKISVQKLLNQQ